MLTSGAIASEQSVEKDDAGQPVLRPHQIAVVMMGGGRPPSPPLPFGDPSSLLKSKNLFEDFDDEDKAREARINLNRPIVYHNYQSLDFNSQPQFDDAGQPLNLAAILRKDSERRTQELMSVVKLKMDTTINLSLLNENFSLKTLASDYTVDVAYILKKEGETSEKEIQEKTE